jgi:hypothetical protein
MPEDTTVKSGTPSKQRENQDAATLTQSQPSTTEELQARFGRPRTDGDPFDQSEQASSEAVSERARPSSSGE